MDTLDSWLEFISRLHWQSIDMGLQRMNIMVERMSLSRPAPQVMTVAGTNGKGSTSVACETLLTSQGYRVGTALSPHVLRYNERLRVDAKEAEDEQICAGFSAVEGHRKDLSLTYFEFSALAALWCFKQAQVDVAILEIGLGGRLDAFNAIDADVAVITSIDLDHQQFLGTTRDAIGAEKAGILRRGQHVVLGPHMPDSVIAACTALDLKADIAGDEFSVAAAPGTATWSILQCADPLVSDLPLGQCAPQNILLAYLAVRKLCPVSATALATVCQALTMPGRLQAVHHGERLWLLDVAHNPAAADFLCRQLELRGLTPQLIVCGMLRDKDHQAVFDAVAAHYGAPWRLIETLGERGLCAASLADTIADTKNRDISVCNSWRQLMTEVNSATQPGDVILLFGSFNVIEQFAPARVAEAELPTNQRSD